MHRLWVHATLQLLVLAATVGTCAGQTAVAGETRVFEWRDAQGVRSYSQKPPPSQTRAVTSFDVETKTLKPAQRAAVRAHLAGLNAAEQADSARFRARVAAADQAVNRALRSLSAAERAASERTAPQAGERVGNAGGGSRLRSEYFDRQKHLEDAVQEARARVDKAYRFRSQIMP